MVIVAIQNAVPIWNDFFFPLVLITSDKLKTLPQGLTVFIGEFTTDWGVMFTGLTLAALPITLLYIVLSSTSSPASRRARSNSRSGPALTRDRP